jgi:ABC-type transporter Mla MlaB component
VFSWACKWRKVCTSKIEDEIARGKAKGTRNEVAPEPMTCRIDRVVTNHGVILHISGQITGQHVDTVRAALEQEDKKVAVDLKEVLLVDAEAVKLLALCEIRGIELRNSPAYIREWVARVKAQRRTEGAE